MKEITLYYTSLVVTSTVVVGLPPVSDCVKVSITSKGGTVRYRVDSIDPSPTDGHKVRDGETITLKGSVAITNFKVIAIDSDATLQITYLK